MPGLHEKFILCPEFWNSFTMIKCNLCVRHFHERKTFNIQHSGGSRGGARGGPPPLFLDQTEARRAEKHFFGRPPPPPPLSKDLDDRPPLSQGLDSAIQHHSPGITLNLRCERLGRLRNICRERNR